MPTVVSHHDFLQALDTPLSHLPMHDAEAYPYLPLDPFYHLFYALLRIEQDVSVAEALWVTLKEYYDALSAKIARYEATHFVAP